ncbi:stalk domain-containing protein [Paenibacillus sp. KS-LC4]|uniref:dioxygenase family protein n=1 Tax=Paenibacillus sp. KS-LC4 TaxID=2979727 RepID=UPI0030D3A6F9
MLKNAGKGYKGFVVGVVITAAVTLPFTTFAQSLQKSISVVYNDIKVNVNGNTVTLKDETGKVLEPFNFAGSVYVPLRGVSEALGMDVTYDSTSKTVTINGGGGGGQPPDGEPPTGTPPTGGTDTSGAGTGTGTTTGTTTSGSTDDTGLTQQVTQGPYYVTGTSQLTSGNLNYDSLTGEKIKVKGYVYAGATGTTPVAGAKVEIWQADDTGNYHPNSNGAASSYTASQLSLRGYVLTDANGYYEYTTIYPGEYTGRTRHIHTNTTATGYKGVITQLIIPSLSGDKMTAAQDNIAQSLPAYNQVTFTAVDGVPTTTFNYRLAVN